MLAMRNSSEARRRLVRQLQGAYSGELAAAFAYRGHANSLPPGADRNRIRQIEAEEWHHRRLVLDLLQQLHEQPSRIREIVFWCIGRALGLLCHVGGSFVPMYGAGKLERGNIVEYEEAAIYAAECGRTEMIDCILTMAEVEWEHELFFRERLTGHTFLTILRLWEPPPPKATIRKPYLQNGSKNTHIA